MQFPTLYGKTSLNKIKIWQVEVKNYSDYSELIIRYGYSLSKMTVATRKITQGKNLNKINSTTFKEQALLEAKSRWNSKISENYVENIDLLDTNEEKIKYSPMLAVDYTKRKANIKFPCYVQPKVDGIRAIFHNNKFISRNGNEFINLKHIKNELTLLIKKDMVLDGELYSNTLSFQELVGLVKLKREELSNEDKIKMTQINYIVYDIINKEPFINRLAILKKFFKENEKILKHVVLLKTEICNTINDIEKYHDKYISEGYEGIIIRNKDGLYKPKYRSGDLQKYKKFIDDEFEIISYTEGKGKDNNTIIFICKTKDNKVFNVRPKGSIEERENMLKNGEKYKGQLLTVRYQELTTDGIPRFPVGIVIRNYE